MLLFSVIKKINKMLDRFEPKFIVSNVKVLIVDNNPISISLHKDYMTDLGCIVKSIKNSTKAIETAEKFLPDLILLDQEMPNLKGLDILELLKKHPELKEANVVMVTGTEDPDFQAKAEALGACLIIEKPIGKNNFLEKIKILLAEYAH